MIASSSEAAALSLRHRIRGILALGLLYAFTGQLGLELAHFQDNATLFWPPTGLSLAALVLFGRWLWPGVVLGTGLVSLIRGTALVPALGICAGNTLEVLVGAALLTDVFRFRPSLSRVRDVVVFLLVGVLGCTLLSPTVGVGTLLLSGNVGAADFWVVWLIWWLGDAGGALVVAPLLFLGLDGFPSWRNLMGNLETWIVFALLALVSMSAFGGALADPWSLLACFLPLPLLVWAGTRLGPRGAVSAAFVTTILAVIGTARGHGPFDLQTAHTSLLLLWAYASAISTAALTLAAAIAERTYAEQRRRTEEKRRHQLEQRMQQTQRQQSLGHLAGGVAHDFNNILTAIRSYAHFLRHHEGDGARRASMFDQIDLSVTRAAELCERLLVYAGRSQPKRTAVSLPTLFSELETIASASISKKTTLEISTPDGLPLVDGDATLLQQLFVNLVLNGAEAIEDRVGIVTVMSGQVSLDASAIARLAGADETVPGQFVYVEVSDSGTGMDETTLRQMFDPFFSTKFAGRGLGLAAALGIVRAHGGGIDVSSTLGMGTTIRAYLRPLAGGLVAEEETRRKQHGSTEGTILICDDEPLVLDVAAAAFRNAGFEVMTASDGREAVGIFREARGRIDAVLLDLTMPELGGLEALEEMRVIDPTIPGVLMSGYQQDAVGGALQSENFIHKPFSLPDLVRRVRLAMTDRPADSPGMHESLGF